MNFHKGVLVHFIFLSGIFLQLCANSSDFATRKPAWKQHKVDILGSHEIQIDEATGERIGLESERQKASLLLLNHAKKLNAQARKNFVQATDGDGHRASANKLGENAGNAYAGNHRGSINTRENEREKIVDLTADRDFKLRASAIDENDRFVAKNDKHEWQIDPEFQDKSLGNGTLKHDRDEFRYRIENLGRGNVEANLEESFGAGNSILHGLSSGSRKKYKCRAQKIGVSTCYDQHGRKVGEVTATDNGEVHVKNKWGVNVAKAKVLKDSDGRPEAILSDGLISARADSYSEQTCPGIPRNEIQILKPLNIFYHGKTKISEGTRFTWPSCFDMSARMKLPIGVSADRIAFEWIVNILPVGRLKCNDVGTCGDDCYYCDWCQGKARHKQIDLLENLNTNVCEGKEGGLFTATATVCPPPESRKWYICSNFTKHFLDEYWKKKGDVHAELRVYERPMEEDFDNQYDNFLTKLVIQGQYATDKATDLTKSTSQSEIFNPTREDMKQWYMKKNHKLVACHQALVSYTLKGSKIDTAFLAEAVGGPGIFEKEPKCIKNAPAAPKTAESDNNRSKVEPQPFGTTRSPVTTTRRGGLAGWLGRKIFG